MLRNLVCSPSTRWFINRSYHSLTPSERSKFHWRYAKIFRDFEPTRFKAGMWTVKFLRKQIKLPLRPDMMWLDWDTAISIVGHDMEIKETYANLIFSPQKPDLFIDIGANYGTHSLLFLAHGITTVSFEPNPVCLKYHKVACDLNALVPRWEPVAVGAKQGSAELLFPERDTWLGSISPETKDSIKSIGSVCVENVNVVTLDDYLANSLSLRDKRNILIKIDVEGGEFDVLSGGRKTIETKAPKIIFESNDPGKRTQLAKFMDEVNYAISLLPWQADQAPQVLQADEFTANHMTNFLAMPKQASR